MNYSKKIDEALKAILSSTTPICTSTYATTPMIPSIPGGGPGGGGCITVPLPTPTLASMPYSYSDALALGSGAGVDQLADIKAALATIASGTGSRLSTALAGLPSTSNTSYVYTTSDNTLPGTSRGVAVFLGDIELNKFTAKKLGDVFYMSTDSILNIFASPFGQKLVKEYNREVRWCNNAKQHNQPSYIADYNTPSYVSNGGGYGYGAYTAPLNTRYEIICKEDVPISLSDALEVFNTFRCMLMIKQELGVEYSHSARSVPTTLSVNNNISKLRLPSNFKEDNKEYSTVSFFTKHKFSPEWREYTAVLDVEKDYTSEIEKCWSTPLSSYSSTTVTPLSGGTWEDTPSLSSCTLTSNYSNPYNYSNYMNQYYSPTSTASPDTVSDRDGVLLFNTIICNEDKFMMTKMQYEL